MNILEQLNKIIHAARTGDCGNAAKYLNYTLTGIQGELSKGVIAALDISKIAYSLETLLDCQKRNDWVAFADVLEYEFIPLWQNANKN